MAKCSSSFRMMRDRRGMAAVEFAMIAPALMLLVVGVMEMTFRFRAKEEATRYVHQVADLIARGGANITTADLTTLYDASVNMMKPVETTSRVDIDIASIVYGSDANLTPRIAWRRIKGTGGQIALNTSSAAGMGGANETVIRVAVRYRYSSPLTTLFGGPNVSIEEEAIARPREVRVIRVDGITAENTAAVPF